MAFQCSFVRPKVKAPFNNIVITVIKQKMVPSAMIKRFKSHQKLDVVLKDQIFALKSNFGQVEVTQRFQSNATGITN